MSTKIEPAEQYRAVIDWLLEKCDDTSEFVRMASMINSYGMLRYDEAWAAAQDDLLNVIQGKALKLFDALKDIIMDKKPEAVVLSKLEELKMAVLSPYHRIGRDSENGHL